MKKAGDIMAEMGFRKEAPESLKEAFLKHLIQSATGVVVQTPTEKKNLNKLPAETAEESLEPIQLCFDLDKVS